jgi:hypothetical protein
VIGFKFGLGIAAAGVTLYLLSPLIIMAVILVAWLFTPFIPAKRVHTAENPNALITKCRGCRAPVFSEAVRCLHCGRRR